MTSAASHTSWKDTQRFRPTADLLPVLIWIADTDKLCTWFNKTWLEFVGRKMEQELGNGWAENVHPADFNRCLETYVTSFDARRSFRMEYRLRRFDGEYLWVLDEGHPMYHDDGAFAGYIGCCLLIDEQKKAHEQMSRVLQKERRIATTLQQASLPAVIPQPADIRFDAVYLPAGGEAEVGGDWYDAIDLDDGSLVVSVGDVSGRGIQAAAIMSKVRHAMGMAPLHEPDPARILDAAGWFLRKRYPDAIVTAFVGIISPDRRAMRYAGAGHPMPLLRRENRLIELEGRGLPLGLRHLYEPSESASIELECGDFILLFTDGLVEARRDIIGGYDVLRRALLSDAVLASIAPGRLVARACLPPEVHDDVAILAVSIGRPERWEFEARDASQAAVARAQFVTYLREKRKDPEFVADAEIVFGELLSNFVRHAPETVEITYYQKDGRDELHFIDYGNPFAVPRKPPADPFSVDGRGLYMVGQLASELRLEHLPTRGNHLCAIL